VKLVEQELWQKEEKGLIGILPVRDAHEIKSAGTTASQGDKLVFFFFPVSSSTSV
jgi:ATP-dependent Lon protease